MHTDRSNAIFSIYARARASHAPQAAESKRAGARKRSFSLQLAFELARRSSSCCPMRAPRLSASGSMHAKSARARAVDHKCARAIRRRRHCRHRTRARARARASREVFASTACLPPPPPPTSLPRRRARIFGGVETRACIFLRVFWPRYRVGSTKRARARAPAFSFLGVFESAHSRFVFIHSAKSALFFFCCAAFDEAARVAAAAVVVDGADDDDDDDGDERFCACRRLHVVQSAHQISFDQQSRFGAIDRRCKFERRLKEKIWGPQLFVCVSMLVDCCVSPFIAPSTRRAQSPQ